MRFLQAWVALGLIAACAPAKDRPAAGEGVVVRSEDPLDYRFDMQQDGRGMSADQFDAWMKARGIRIAKGVPARHLRK
ncbi:hypothetical protein B1992_12065 [Pseudoxanthomonas broegbernensis]|uniref:Uncharacterized protein n=1 Tax=Pseudoxanthomonas broegbernensis TaxID=83619 RepID=A0A7V8K6R4_9GAMM|nr:hypothetical protein B1992_12065 [Pseudoxanthomonas broegbernensis]